ncbi:MAG TPA: hypothetical protein VJB63_01250 [Patescibacteria group bacterium]|nr:hypothetical protein [Patescibacteria group bacterium]
MFNFFVVLAQGSVTIPQATLPGLNDLKISDIITFAIRGLFVIGGLLALIYLLLGGMAWITSGGNKESVDKARDKISAAVIGLIVIVAVVAIIALLEKVLNIGLGVSLPIEFPCLIKSNNCR